MIFRALSRSVCIIVITISSGIALSIGLRAQIRRQSAVTTTAGDINIVLSTGVCLGASVPHSHESTLTLLLTLDARCDVVEQVSLTLALTKAGRRKCRADVGVPVTTCRQRTTEEDRSNMSCRQPPSVQLVYVFCSVPH